MVLLPSGGHVNYFSTVFQTVPLLILITYHDAGVNACICKYETAVSIIQIVGGVLLPGGGHVNYFGSVFQVSNSTSSHIDYSP